MAETTAAVAVEQDRVFPPLGGCLAAASFTLSLAWSRTPHASSDSAFFAQETGAPLNLSAPSSAVVASGVVLGLEGGAETLGRIADLSLADAVSADESERENSLGGTPAVPERGEAFAVESNRRST
jgi:hypothetical protein